MRWNEVTGVFRLSSRHRDGDEPTASDKDAFKSREAGGHGVFLMVFTDFFQYFSGKLLDKRTIWVYFIRYRSEKRPVFSSK